MSFNKDPVSNILNDCIQVLDLCLMHKDVYLHDKNGMMKIIEREKSLFYHEYYRVCVTLVGYQIETDIGKLLVMLEKMYNVQEGMMDKGEYEKMVIDGLNKCYVEPVLNSSKLKEERKNKGYVS